MKTVTLAMMALAAVPSHAFDNCPNVKTMGDALQTDDVEIMVNEDVMIRRGNSGSSILKGSKIRVLRVDPVYDQLIESGTKIVIRAAGTTLDSNIMIPLSNDIESIQYLKYMPNIHTLEELKALTSAEVIRCVPRVRLIK